MGKAKKKAQGMWKHFGGGCNLQDAGKHPCDDQYANKKTGKLATFATSMDAHFNMPESVRDIEKIKDLSGVKLVNIKDLED